jgi:hypothetical protein
MYAIPFGIAKMGELSAGLPKVARRFVAEMVFKIQARGSVRLTKVGRSLGEQAAPRIEDDTLLVLDLSEVTKKYAEKTENLSRVRDGSGKELGWGYWTLNIVGANTKGTKLVPL